MSKIKVINLYVENLKSFIDQIEEELILNNISYCLIKDSDYNVELHYQDKMYRLIDFECVKIVPLTANKQMKIKIPEDYKEKVKKEQPGYKKYTKSSIKQDNKKVNNKGYTKRFTYGK